MRYKIILKKWPEMAKALRICGNCSKQYEVEVMTGDYHWPSFLECNNCQLSLRYSEAVDYLYHEITNGKLTRHNVMRIIEEHAPDCPKCGGRFKHIDGSLYGMPTHCPHCGVSQVECKSPIKFLNPTLSRKDRIRYVSEDVYWLEAVKEETDSK